MFERIFGDLEPAYVAQASDIFQFFRRYPRESDLWTIDLASTPMREALKHEMTPISREQAIAVVIFEIRSAGIPFEWHQNTCDDM